MTYVEFLRVRNAFVWYAGITGFVILCLVLSLHSGHVNLSGNVGFDDGDGSGSNISIKDAHGKLAVHAAHALAIPLGALFGLCGYCAAVFATVLGSTLHQQLDTLHLVFTKPVSRERIAISSVIVDFCGILVAYLFTLCIVCLTPLASVGLLTHVFVDQTALPLALLGLGIAFMWYGLLQAATSWHRGKAGAIVGASWALFVILVALQEAPVGPLFHGLVTGLNFVNPLAYLSSVSVSGDAARAGTVIALPMDWRVALVWIIGFVACAGAIWGWKRVEV